MAWAGPGRLVYTAGPRNSDRSQFSHWTIDLRTGKSRRIAGPETNLSFPGRISEGGRYELDDLHTVTPAGKVVRYKPAPNPWTDPSVGKDGIQAFTIKSSDPAKPGKFTFDGVDLFTLTGPGKQVSPSKYFSSTYWNAAKNQLYVKETESREAKRLYRVDWAATKFTLLCEYGFSIDWWPERAKYAFSTPRNMVKYGPTKHLYSSELWVGDLRLGITRPIRRGEVEIWAVAVQPL